MAFLRITTNPKIFETPAPIENAWSKAQEWLALDNVWIALPGQQHSFFINKLIPQAASRPNLIPDIHLAALAMEHGLTVYSADKDFLLLPKVPYVNPLD